MLPLGASRAAGESLALKKEGDEHLKGDRFAPAAECYRRALAKSPDYADACIGLGFALSEQQHYDEAERHLGHALAIDPGNADAHYILGTIARRRSDHARSIECFTRAVEIKPDFTFAYRELLAALLQAGQRREAKGVLHKAIAANPESAEFQFHLGNLLSQEQDYDNAIACYEKALSIQPASAETFKHLADALDKCGQFEQAVASYQKALWFEPNYVEAHCALGGVMRSRGRSDKAIECYNRAVALQPDSAAAHIGLGNVLESQGRLDEAVACYRRALELEPDMVVGLQYLANALVAQGANREAVALYEKVVRLDPGNPVRHLIAALSGGDTDRAPAEYVEKLFDEYAQKFDSHLVNVLSYSVPEKLAETLRPHVPPNGGKWDILDLGCGTGLSGVAIAPHARQLVGVDLSTKMLDKARERNLYQRLVQQDLLTMMQGEPESTYDVVLAADVFVYIGKLDELVTEARRLLRPGGFFAFSVESLDDLSDETFQPSDRGDYRLNVTGRYAHSKAYLSRRAAHDGFAVLATTRTQSRLDKGKPVQGYLSLWRSPTVTQPVTSSRS